MNYYEWSALTPAQQARALRRPENRFDADVSAFVRTLFQEVASDGQGAVCRWAEELDGAPPGEFKIDDYALNRARSSVTDEGFAALQFAKENIERFHTAEPSGHYSVSIEQGVNCARVVRPFRTAGIYVPAGTAPLFSTLMMLVIPANIAGVKDLVVCTPPNDKGEIDPLIILSAGLCGVDRLYSVGGAQAIAAMAYGTRLVPKADIITGPGNAYVAAAKSYAAGLPAGPVIDMPAGPSELLVIADNSADPCVVAADLISQAEHDPMAQVLLVALDPSFLAQVRSEVSSQLRQLPRREIASAAMAHARFIIAESVEQAILISNRYAPEHLSLNVQNAECLVEKNDTAGTVFVGPYAAETFGDYVAGPSHVLPTDGAARAWSGVSVSTFQRSMTIQRVSMEGAAHLAPAAATLARLESLEGHARAAEIRYGPASKAIG